MKRTQCPACRSLNTTVTDLFGRSGSQAFKNRVCRDCKTAWRPQSPKWLGIALIVLGVAIPLIQSTAAQYFRDIDVALGRPLQKHSGNIGSLYYVMCFAAVSYGLMILFGKVGKLKILGKVETLGK